MTTGATGPTQYSYGPADILMDPIGARDKGNKKYTILKSIFFGVITVGMAHVGAAIARNFCFKKTPPPNETHKTICAAVAHFFGNKPTLAQLAPEFGLHLDNPTQLTQELNTLNQQIQDKIPQNIQTKLGLTQPVDQKNLKKCLQALSDYSLLVIYNKLPQTTSVNWESEFKKNVSDTTKKFTKEKPQTVPITSFVKVSQKTKIPLPICIPSLIQKTANTLNLTGTDLSILHNVPPTLAVITLQHGQPQLGQPLPLPGQPLPLPGQQQTAAAQPQGLSLNAPPHVPGQPIMDLKQEFGIAPSKKVDQKMLDRLDSKIETKIPQATRNLLGLPAKLQATNLQQQLQTLSDYSLLVILGKLPDPNTPNWKQAFDTAVQTAKIAVDTDKKQFVKVNSPVGINANTSVALPICVPSCLLQSATHLQITGPDLEILPNSLPQNITTLTLRDVNHRSLSRLAQTSGPGVTTITVNKFKNEQQQPKKIDLKKTFPSLANINTEKLLNIDILKGALSTSSASKVSFQSITKQYLGGTSDHTWRLYKIDDGEGLEIELGTQNLMDLCTAPSGPKYCGNNPMGDEETNIEEYRLRKEEQLANIVDNLRKHPLQATHNLQEVDFWYFGEKAEMKITQGTLFKDLPQLEQCQLTLLRKFRTDLDHAGWGMIGTNPSLPKNQQDPLLTLYKKDTIAPDPSSQFLVGCFKSKEGKYRAAEGQFNLLTPKNIGKKLSIPNVHLDYNEIVQDELLDFQIQRMNQGILVCGLGDFNRCPNKDLFSAATNWNMVTNVDAKNASMRGDPEQLTDKDRETGLNKTYDIAFVSPAAPGKKVTMTETFTEHFVPKSDGSPGFERKITDLSSDPHSEHIANGFPWVRKTALKPILEQRIQEALVQGNFAEAIRFQNLLTPQKTQPTTAEPPEENIPPEAYKQQPKVQQTQTYQLDPSVQDSHAQLQQFQQTQRNPILQRPQWLLQTLTQLQNMHSAGQPLNSVLPQMLPQLRGILPQGHSLHPILNNLMNILSNTPQQLEANFRFNLNQELQQLQQNLNIQGLPNAKKQNISSRIAEIQAKLSYPNLVTTEYNNNLQSLFIDLRAETFLSVVALQEWKLPEQQTMQTNLINLLMKVLPPPQQINQPPQQQQQGVTQEIIQAQSLLTRLTNLQAQAATAQQNQVNIPTLLQQMPPEQQLLVLNQLIQAAQFPLKTRSMWTREIPSRMFFDSLQAKNLQERNTLFNAYQKYLKTLTLPTEIQQKILQNLTNSLNTFQQNYEKLFQDAKNPPHITRTEYEKELNKLKQTQLDVFRQIQSWAQQQQMIPPPQQQQQMGIGQPQPTTVPPQQQQQPTTTTGPAPKKLQLVSPGEEEEVEEEEEEEIDTNDVLEEEGDELGEEEEVEPPTFKNDFTNPFT